MGGRARAERRSLSETARNAAGGGWRPAGPCQPGPDLAAYGVRGPRRRVTVRPGSARISSSVKRTSRQRLDA